MNLLNFAQFYKNTGVFRIHDLASPEMLDMASLPKDAVLLHMPKVMMDNDNIEVDVDPSAIYLQHYDKKIPISFCEEYIGPVGGYIEKTVNIELQAKQWLKGHKEQFRFQAAGTIDFSFNTPNIINYGYLVYKYQYPTGVVIAMRNKFLNQYKTMVADINRIGTTSSKSCFFFCELGRDIPSFSTMENMSNQNSASKWKLLNEDYENVIYELWLWVDPATRTKSVFAGVSPKALKGLNIIFVNEQNKTCTINLGYIDAWIKGRPNELNGRSETQYSVDHIKKLFLKFLLTMVSFFEEPKSISEEVGELGDDLKKAGEELTNTESGDYDAMSAATKEQKISAKIADTVDRINTVAKAKDESGVTSVSIDTIVAEIDKDIDVLDKTSKLTAKRKGVILDQKGNIVEVSEPAIQEIDYNEVVRNHFTSVPDEAVLVKKIDELAESKFYSAADYRKAMAGANAITTMVSPYDRKAKYLDSKVIKPEDLLVDKERSQMNVSHLVVDKDMAQSSLNSFTPDYVRKNMKKDMMNVVASFQRAGFTLVSHEVEKTVTAFSAYEVHDITFKPLNGVSSSVRAQIPIVNEQGEFMSTGNKYSLRPQGVDKPIRKIGPSSVALTSYYGKTFVKLSERKADSSVDWLVRRFYELKELTEAPRIVEHLAPAKVFDNYNKAPFIYNALADRIRLVEIKGHVFTFNCAMREEEYGPKAMLDALYEKHGLYVCGMSVKGEMLALDNEGIIHELIDAKKNAWQKIGTFYTLTDCSENDGPLNFSTLAVFGKAVPTGVVLSYYMGISALLVYLKEKYKLKWRVVEGRRNRDVQDNEFAVIFADQSLIFEKTNRICTMLLAGFNHYSKEVKGHELAAFNHQDVYFNLLRSKKLGVIYMRELDNMLDMFVDPITRSTLQDMGEPDVFEPLLIRATELLTTYDHPDSQDTNYQMFRGYERFAGALYKQLSLSAKAYRNKNTASGRARLDMKPFAVWQTVMQDSAIKMCEDINPVQTLKEREIFTYVGEGGRSKEAIPKAERAYHINSVGTVGEGGIDSGDVGTSAYLSANPNLVSQRGLISTNPSLNPTTMLSTSSLLGAGLMRDDSKRVVFAGVQNSHTVAAKGYHPPIVGTGYEYVMAHRMTDMFAATAIDEGVVKSITAKGIVVEYKNGDLRGVTLGRQFGRAEGSVYPHDIVVMQGLKEGTRFKKGQVLAYNNGFFEVSMYDPTTVVLKSSMNVLTMFNESADVHEDSFAISKSVADKFEARTTHVRSVTLDFVQEVFDVVKVGQTVGPEDPLLVIQDEVTSMGTFSEASLNTLRKRSSQAPKAQYRGTIDKIEVFYNGDVEDMSGSIRELADKSDKDLASTCKASAKPVVTGEDNDGYRVAGVPLSLDRVELRFYITVANIAGVGDKGVIGHQMKGTCGRVMTGRMYTKDGRDIDVSFSFRSIMKRVVMSTFDLGTTASLLIHIGKQAYLMK